MGGNGTGCPMKLLMCIRSLVALLAVGAMTACASVPKRNPVPEEWAETATIPGIPYARFWGDGLPPDYDERIEAVRARVQANNPEAVSKAPTFLAVSGGGANGAFGAGLLNGWTAAGDRPEFTMVTGISTGALIAPFAFLGPAYDEDLKVFYTTVSTEDILKKRNPLTALTGDAIASTEPLKALIARYVDGAFLQALARECNRGRGLLIGTTNLDSGRPVVWSICTIATSGDPKALELVREILRASAAIPGAFPPIYFEVEANGQRYDEMHVDGGATSQVFLYPAKFDFHQFLEDVGLKGEPRMYVIQNARLEQKWEAVKPKLGAIIGRSILTLIETQGEGDVYRIYLGAQRDGVDFNLAYIPDSFGVEPQEPFDQNYMQTLFLLGYDLAKDGYPWENAPLGFAPP